MPSNIDRDHDHGPQRDQQTPRHRNARASSVTSISTVGTATSRIPRPPSIVSNSNRRVTTSHSRGHSSDEPSQPPSPMTYFPNPSTFTQEPVTVAFISSIQTSPSLASIRLDTSASHSSLSSENEHDLGTPRVVPSSEMPQGAQQLQFPTPTHATTMPPSPVTASPRIGARRSASIAAPHRSGYGATGHLAAPLGTSVEHSALGLVPGPSIDTRRIASTSQVNLPTPSRGQPPATAHPTGLHTTLPSVSPHGGHTHSHSQPTTAVGTPRQRREEPPTPSFAAALGRSTHQPRGLSLSSTLAAPTPHLIPPASPSGSIFNRLKRNASHLGVHRPHAYDDDSDDDGYDDFENEGKRANGTRVWYSSYVTIDWLHDAIKESSRIRRVRHLARRSFRGAVMNAWDRFQGWLVVTLVGVLTALMAFCIIRSEMSFFDSKEGFCSRSWGTAKRFCCPPVHAPGGGGVGGTHKDCPDWVEWGQYFGNVSEDDPDASFWSEPEFIAYFFIALALACTASALTYYITSSATHVTSKDSAFLGPAPPDIMSPLMSPRATKTPTERQPLLQEQQQNGADHNGDDQEDDGLSQPARPVIYMAAGSGIPEIKTILSGFVIHGYLGMSTLLTKSFGLALSVGSGLSLGKEGPFVHISSCIANIISRAFTKYEQNEGKRREILSAACAAGVAVSFGAPIGGVLFSLEEASYYFPPKVMWRSFWCAAVAAITLKAMNPYGNGSLVLFAVTYTKEYHYWEFGIFIILGVFGGLYGALFSRLNIVWSREVRKKTWLSRHPITEVALVTALTTVVSFMNPYTRLGGTELIAKLFADCKYDSTSPLCIDRTFAIWPIISAIGGALIIKAILTIITFGVVLPAGIFIPSLAIGACFGRIVGVVLEYCEYHYSLPIFDNCGTEPCVVAGIYAMVGAAATLAGVTRTTVSLAVIMFELTGTLNYVVPVMLSVLVAKTVADGLEKRGIYELVIELKKLPYLSNKEEYLWGGRLVSEVMDREAPSLRADKSHTVRELTGRLLELVRLGYADAGFPVLTKEPTVGGDGRSHSCFRIVGFIGINELEHALTELQDEPDAVVNLAPDEGLHSSRMSIFSFTESHEGRHNPYDLSQYIDRAPITVQVHSPLELVQQMFVKLGARQILVTDSRGAYRGALYKKQWIAFLDDLEHEGLEWYGPRLYQS